MWWLSGKEGTGKYKLPSLEDSSSAKFFNFFVRELDQILTKTNKVHPSDMKEINVNLMLGKVDKRKKEIPAEKIGISIKASIGFADNRAKVIDTL